MDKDLEFKEKELTTHALHLAHKNEVLLDLKSQLEELKADSKNARQYQKIINHINLDINNDNNWEQFRAYFEDVHKDFNAKVMRNYPDLSNNDLRLMSLLKMNLSSKEIASILNISVEGVKKARYRLRKKLNLNTEESLQQLVIEL
jgi:DNA-binding CsgD family transcriptional regulator